MAELIYSAITSLDGYVADEDGKAAAALQRRHSARRCYRRRMRRSPDAG